MEEIEVWTVDGSQVTRLTKSNQMESELLLEDVLVENPGLLLEDLTLVGRQTPTEGGPLDLLGVDGEGKLVVFELKRGTLSRDAVAQVIDYASYLDTMNMDELAEHISQNSGKQGINKIDDFTDWYSQQGFENSESLESLKPLRMVLVGLGVDDRTERMTRFLAENSGMDISLLTFHGFTMDGRTILAKRVEVKGTEDFDPRSTGGYLSRAARRELFSARAKELGVVDLIETVRRMFMETSQVVFQSRYSVSESPRQSRITFSLLETAASGNPSYRSYFSISLDPEPGIVQIWFYPRAIELCLNTFERLERQDSFLRRTPSYAGTTEQVQWDIVLPLNTQEDWEAYRDEVTEVTKDVYVAWLNRREEGESAST